MARRDVLTIGVDIGTTAVKAVVLDPDRGIVARATRPNRLLTPHPGWAEASTAEWRENVLSVLTELAAGVAPRRVAAIAVAGMVPAVVCVGAEGRALRPAILQNDGRATSEIDEVAAMVAVPELLRTVGSAVTQQSVAPTALWLARHEPDVWASTTDVLGSYDWVLRMLGADAHLERNWALESGLFTIEGDLFDPMCAVAALRGRLRAVVESGTVVGALDPGIAAEVGVPAGTPLVVGGADHVLSAFGAGLITPGDWLIKLGGAGDILAVAPDPVVDERFYLDAHPLPGLWLPNGCMATSGSLVRWVQSLLQVDDLATMDQAAASRSPASLLCLPYFLGEKSPLNDPDLRGIFAGLHLGQDRVDLYRAALEGIAFAFRHNAEVLTSAGVELARATVTNGGATSLLWKRILASTLEVSLQSVQGHPGASLGAAVAAAVGIGALTEWASITHFVHPGVPIDPDPDWAKRYKSTYPIWLDLGRQSAIPMRAFARS